MKTRNFALEEIVLKSKMRVYCRNLGCNKTPKIENLKDHMEANCEYRYLPKKSFEIINVSAGTWNE
jgi:hypothetical protein